MKAAVVKGNSRVEIENFDISDIGSNELLIKMQSCYCIFIRLGFF